ncbi:hypothetical protein ADL22_10010 [Streptomyces sp. NRRL F-4489]|uniref:hypothetical protein n=1 Tax=Streptomyces sp. NRRL F-4489 TaxID=1609095 RepID=UPI0007472B28|nr:hypothetical protein [Streptomyces sp. NRRL F-4489]KUL47393.1 hypothetical protein ADL22_10010 [Streptomyces sp. NRRL F-4489]
MKKSASEVLRELSQQSHVAIHSSPGLVGSVEAAAADDDKKRKENELDALRRKPELQPLRVGETGSLGLTPWEVLHTLGRAMALSRRGAGRGLAEHWGALKYTQALTGGPDSFMKLSAEGRDTADYYKALQSGELGIGFALALAQRILLHRYPDHVVSIVPADTALRAGWALTSRDKGPRLSYRYRPDFFAEVWKPGEPSRAFPIACKGNHGNAAISHGQLASASAHVEAVHIGDWDETPSLVFSTELPLDGPLTVHTLHAEGRGGWLTGSERAPGGSLDDPLKEENHFPGIQPPAEGDKTRAPEPGFHVTPERFDWFRRVIARTAAAGLTAFAGDGEATAPYLSTRQGQRRFTGTAHAATGSVQDAQHTLLGMRFVGTDHVFRLNRTRVEAFSGVDATLFGHLANGRVEQYRGEVYARRSAWPQAGRDPKWGGPVSVQPDGSVLAMRLLAG